MLIIHSGSANVFAEQGFEPQTCANMLQLWNQRVEKQGLRHRNTSDEHMNIPAVSVFTHVIVFAK